MKDYNLDDTQYERAVEKEDERQAMQHDIENEYIDNFESFYGALVLCGPLLAEPFHKKMIKLCYLCATEDWDDNHHQDEAYEFLDDGLGNIVAETKHYRNMVVSWFCKGEIFDTREINLAQLFFMYVWHQDRKYADSEIVECFNELISDMAEHFSKLH